jgi:hypothetical protein
VDPSPDLPDDFAVADLVRRMSIQTFIALQIIDVFFGPDDLGSVGGECQKLLRAFVDGDMTRLGSKLSERRKAIGSREFFPRLMGMMTWHDFLSSNCGKRSASAVASTKALMAHAVRCDGAEISAVTAAISEEFVGVFLGLFFRIAITLFENAGELILLAFNDFEIVISQPAPLLLDFAFQLFPVSGHGCTVHRISP